MQLLSDRKQVELNQNLVKKPITQNIQRRKLTRRQEQMLWICELQVGNCWRPQTPTRLWEDERLELAGQSGPSPYSLCSAFFQLNMSRSALWRGWAIYLVWFLRWGHYLERSISEFEEITEKIWRNHRESSMKKQIYTNAKEIGAICLY